MPAKIFTLLQWRVNLRHRVSNTLKEDEVHILLVEDDVLVASGVVAGLTLHGLTVSRWGKVITTLAY